MASLCAYICAQMVTCTYFIIPQLFSITCTSTSLPAAGLIYIKLVLLLRPGIQRGGLVWCENDVEVVQVFQHVGRVLTARETEPGDDTWPYGCGGKSARKKSGACEYIAGSSNEPGRGAIQTNSLCTMRIRIHVRLYIHSRVRAYKHIYANVLVYIHTCAG